MKMVLGLHMNETIKIPEDNSLNSFEGVPEPKANQFAGATSTDLTELRTGDAQETSRQLGDLRQELSANTAVEAATLRESVRNTIEGVKWFYQQFNADKKDLSDDIVKIKEQLLSLNVLIAELKQAQIDGLRDELLPLKSGINSFLEAAEESKIGKRAWLSGGMKNRDEVIFWSNRLFNNLKTFLEKNS